jgi:hypothetical protein
MTDAAENGEMDAWRDFAGGDPTIRAGAESLNFAHHKEPCS